MTVPLSRIELSRSALCHNVQVMRAAVGRTISIIAAVKANAYGHGLTPVAEALNSEVEGYQVDDIEEYLALRPLTALPIYVLGYLSPASFTEVWETGGIPAIMTPEQLFWLQQQTALFEGASLPYILSCDAGFGREGFLLSELPSVVELLRQFPFLRCTGLYGHYSCVDDPDLESETVRQQQIFKEAEELFQQYFPEAPTHIAASAGTVLSEQQYPHSMVRLGISLYGMAPSSFVQQKLLSQGLHLLPVLSWKSTVARIKELPTGSPVGYGATYKTTRPTKIALIPQGYSDGIVRLLSNKGVMLTHGQRAPIIGRVSMNFSVIEVTSIPEVKEGDEVVLLGSQGNTCITAEELGELTSTINYEVTTRISPLLPRVLRD